MPTKAQKDKNPGSDQPVFCKCRLHFKGPVEYGHAIHSIKGTKYDLEPGAWTEVDLAHLEALKKAEPNLEVLKDGIN